MSTASFGSAASPLQPVSPKDGATAPVLSHKTATEQGALVAVNSNPPVIRQKIAALIANIESVIVGKREAVKYTLVGLIARGHVLIEDVPGVGKTTLARALAR